jgi:hypothetical protein
MSSQLMPPSITAAVALCTALAGADLLRADHVTFGFTGTVENVFDGLDQLDSSVAMGTEFSGTYTFDPDTPNTAEPGGEGEAGLYEHDAPPAGVTIDVGSFTFRSVAIAPDFDVIVNNDFGFAGSDDYGFISHNNEAIGLPNPELADQIAIQWFAQSFNNPFDSVNLPVTPPDLSLLGGGLLSIRGECTPCVGPADFFEIEGTLISLTPEPGTWTLVVLGAMVFAGGRRRHGLHFGPN